MSVEDIFCVRFDFIDHSKVDEFEDTLNDLIDTADIDISSSLSDISTGYVEVGHWSVADQYSDWRYDDLDLRIYSYQGYLLVQTRLYLSERARRQWLLTEDSVRSRQESVEMARSYTQILSELNQICSEYPSFVNRVSSDNPPVLLHCTVDEPPGASSITEWIQEHNTSLQALGFTQTSGLQTIVDGTYLVALESFPEYSSGLIAINIFTSAQQESVHSSDAKSLFETLSRYHLAYYIMAEYDQRIDSKAELSVNAATILGEEQLDGLVEIETTLIEDIGWCNEVQSNLQPQSPLFKPESIPEEQTICRSENGELAETTYFEYYRSELNEIYQKQTTSIENVRSQNERLLDLVRDRISAIGTQANVQLQTAIYRLTIFMAVVSTVSLIIAFV